MPIFGSATVAWGMGYPDQLSSSQTQFRSQRAVFIDSSFHGSVIEGREEDFPPKK